MMMYRAHLGFLALMAVLPAEAQVSTPDAPGRLYEVPQQFCDSCKPPKAKRILTQQELIARRTGTSDDPAAPTGKIEVTPIASPAGGAVTVDWGGLEAPAAGSGPGAGGNPTRPIASQADRGLPTIAPLDRGSGGPSVQFDPAGMPRPDAAVARAQQRIAPVAGPLPAPRTEAEERAFEQALEANAGRNGPAVPADAPASARPVPLVPGFGGRDAGAAGQPAAAPIPVQTAIARPPASPAPQMTQPAQPASSLLGAAQPVIAVPGPVPPATPASQPATMPALPASPSTIAGSQVAGAWAAPIEVKPQGPKTLVWHLRAVDTEARSALLEPEGGDPFPVEVGAYVEGLGRVVSIGAAGGVGRLEAEHGSLELDTRH